MCPTHFSDNAYPEKIQSSYNCRNTFLPMMTFRTKIQPSYNCRPSFCQEPVLPIRKKIKSIYYCRYTFPLIFTLRKEIQSSYNNRYNFVADADPRRGDPAFLYTFFLRGPLEWIQSSYNCWHTFPPILILRKEIQNNRHTFLPILTQIEDERRYCPFIIVDTLFYNSSPPEMRSSLL
jgi:hypothetical protein